MLEKVFWDYFKSTGNVDAYLAAKDFDNDDKDCNSNKNSFSDLTNNTQLESNNTLYSNELNM